MEVSGDIRNLVSYDLEEETDLSGNLCKHLVTLVLSYIHLLGSI